MARQQRSWQLDWAGRHGTALGTVNAVFCTFNATLLACLVLGPHLPALWVTLAGSGLGVVYTLARAALARKRIPGATTGYKLACWSGIAVWSTRAAAAWPNQPQGLLPAAQWWAGQGLILIAAAVVAGLIAGLADGGPEPDQEPTEPTPIDLDNDPVQADYDRTANEWAQRVQRVCGFPVKVLAIDVWDNRAGYSVELVLPEGGKVLDDVRAAANRLASDANLPPGCTVVARPGPTRRVVVLEVAVKSFLAEERHYPADITPLTVNEAIPIGFDASADEGGIELRQKSAVFIGEQGSGKTNLLRVVSAGLARCVDVVQWHIDLTGAGLSRPWLKPWLDGHANRPTVDWVARDADEAMRMCRAALRIGYARKQAYQDLMDSVDDDKIPISPDVPEVVIVVDEIASITGSRSKYPELRDLLIQINQELRASGVRIVLAGLRATDDVIVNSVLSLIPIKVGLRVTKRAELAWLFEWSDGISPEDVPYDGSYFVQRGSGAKPLPERAYRMVPSRIRQIAMVTDEWRPALDGVSECAANGYDADGKPLIDTTVGRVLPESERGCYDRRWDGWSDGAGPQRGEPTTPPLPSSPPPYVGPRETPEEVIAATKAAVDQLDDRIAESNGLDPGQARRDREAFDRIIAGEEWSTNWEDPAEWSKPPASEPATGWQDRAMAVIVKAGPDGAGPKEILAALAAEGVAVHRDTLHDQLRAWKRDDVVHQPRYGRWAAGGESQ